MATVSEDKTTATPSAAFEVGGAGGKFRKRPFRRAQTTPYDRPSTSLRNPSWLSKLVVDPASKLINAGARRFFDSFFHKTLPPPPVLPAIAAPPPPETKQDSRDVHQASGAKSHAGDLDPDIHKHGDAACNFEGSAFSELEQLLQRKTFTRSEIDQLTELLHSKAVDSSPHGDAGNEIDVSKPASDVSKGLLGDSKTERRLSLGVATTALINKKIHDNDVASPAELAKSYMGSRQSKVSPSMLSFRSQTVREVVPFVSQSPIMPFAKRPGVTDNGFTTPKSRGRSALYNMARTPYSRVRPTNFQKGGSSTNYLHAGPSSSQSRLEHDDVFGSKQLSLKRRSSVIDDGDIGSIGPIRRTRQKSNLSYNSGVSLPTRGTGTVSAAPKHQLFPTRTLDKKQDGVTPSTSRFLVPTKSSETAAKILEVISKLSPREKTSESKRTAIKDKSPTKLTMDMLHGQALRSLEHLDSSRLLQSAPSTIETENHVNAIRPDGGNSTLPKLDNVEENQPTKFVGTASHVARSEVTFSVGGVPAYPNSVYPMPVSVPPKERRTFKMSAHEDSFELDDDIKSSGPASKPLSEGTGKQEMALINRNPVSTEAQLQHKIAPLPEINIPPGNLSKKIYENTSSVNADAKCTDLSTSVDIQTTKSKNAYGVDTEGSNLNLPGKHLEILSSPNNHVSATTSNCPQPAVDDNSKVSFNGKTEASMVASTSTTSLFAAPSTNLSNGKFSSYISLSTSTLAASNSESHTITSASGEAANSISAATTTVSMTSSVFGLGSSMFSSTTFSTSTASNTEASDKIENSVGSLKNSGVPGSSSADDTNSIFGLDSSVKQPSIPTQSQGSLFNAGGDSFASANLMRQSGSTNDPHTTSSQFGLSTSSAGLDTSGVTPFSSFTSTAPATKSFGSDSFRPTSAQSSQAGSSSASSSIFAFGDTTASSEKTSLALPSNGSTSSTPSFGVSSVSPAPETKALSPSIGSSPAVFSFSGTSTLSSSNGGPSKSIFASGSAASTSSSTAPVVFSSNTSSATPASSSMNTGGFSFGGSSAASSSTSTTAGLFSFGASSAASSSSSTTPGVFSFGGGSTPSSSSSTTPGVFSFGASSAVSSSSNTTPGGFNFGGGSAASSTSNTTSGVFSFGASSAASSTSNTTPGVFGFGGSSGAFSSSSSVFSFGASSPALSSAAAVSNSTPGTFNFGASSSASSSAAFGSTTSMGFTTFGSSTSASFSTPKTTPTPFGAAPSSGSMFGFGVASSTSTSQSIFGNSTPPSFTASHDQMTMEDTMAEDPVQASTPSVSVFGQPSNPLTPSSSFVFGSPNPFQFGGPQNQAAPQNPSPFQASGSLEFGGGGSFSLGSSGPDKSGRKIVKVNRSKNRKK